MASHPRADMQAGSGNHYGQQHSGTACVRCCMICHVGEATQRRRNSHAQDSEGIGCICWLLQNLALILHDGVRADDEFWA